MSAHHQAPLHLSDQWFSRLARAVALRAGHPLAFGVASSIVLTWFIAGFFVGFTDTFYQLLINTGTTIVTFLMVFLIQNSQNRDAATVHLLLAELIRSNAQAHDALLDLEELTEADLTRLLHAYERLAQRSRDRLADLFEEADYGDAANH